MKARATARVKSAAAAPCLLRNALTKTVESTTALSMLAAQFFYQAGDLFFLLLRALAARWLFCVDALKQVEEVFPCLATIHNRYRFEENAVLHGFGF